MSMASLLLSWPERTPAANEDYLAHHSRKSSQVVARAPWGAHCMAAAHMELTFTPCQPPHAAGSPRMPGDPRGNEYYFSTTEAILVPYAQRLHTKDGVAENQTKAIVRVRGHANDAHWCRGFNFSERFAQSILPLATSYIADINKGGEFCFGEVLIADELCKLFADLEFYETPGNVGLNLDLMVERFIERALSKLDGVPNNIIVLYSIRPGKKSAHVYFPHVFRAVDHLKAFVSRLTEEMKACEEDRAVFGLADGGWGVDVGVYDTNKCFRIYGAIKLVQGQDKRRTVQRNPLLTRQEHEAQAALNAAWEAGGKRGARPIHPRSIKTLLQTLVGVNVQSEEERLALPPLLRDNCPVISGVWSCSEVTAAPRLHFAAVKPNAVKRARPSETIENKMVVKLMETALPFKGIAKNKITLKSLCLNNRKQQVATIRIACDPSIVCPNKGSSHLQNGSYFIWNLNTRDGHFKCLDPECRALGKFGWGTYKP
jgi:hypothetical protein